MLIRARDQGCVSKVVVPGRIVEQAAGISNAFKSANAYVIE
jgi:hypothetical protein